MCVSSSGRDHANLLCVEDRCCRSEHCANIFGFYYPFQTFQGLLVFFQCHRTHRTRPTCLSGPSAHRPSQKSYARPLEGPPGTLAAWCPVLLSHHSPVFVSSFLKCLFHLGPPTASFTTTFKCVTPDAFPNSWSERVATPSGALRTSLAAL